MKPEDYPNAATEDSWTEQNPQKPKYRKLSSALERQQKEDPAAKHKSENGRLLRNHVIAMTRFAVPYVDRDKPVFSRVAVLTYLSEIWGAGRKWKNVKLFACLLAEQFTSHVLAGVSLDTRGDVKKALCALNLDRDVEDVFVLLNLHAVCFQCPFYDEGMRFCTKELLQKFANPRNVTWADETDTGS